VSFFEALKGGDIPVNTLDGQVMLKVPAGVTTGSKLRIKHKGAGAGDVRGNQIVTLKVVMPKKIDPELADAVRELEKKFSYDPRVTS
jgi:DnaJ-class molecular chaperone